MDVNLNGHDNGLHLADEPAPRKVEATEVELLLQQLSQEALEFLLGILQLRERRTNRKIELQGIRKPATNDGGV